ncbi:RNA polymerase sigma-70 factor [Nocardia sp. GCM10030253]|uniref:RNA polymerase sigma-70 factor n=1 Tax=Nocardia sp. GCM10030253 TaxID=3273404 RepID=UPI00363392D5
MAGGSAEEFEGQRGRLFGVAYRMLGSAEEAEDVVQDAFVRWGGVDRAAIVSPSAWLAKVVTNLCLNRLTAARALREEYIGPWLPEPVLTAEGALGPLESAEQRDSVSFALLVLLERLTPAERAVFVLREAFAYSYREIAEIMELSEANSRQLSRRARERVDDGHSRFQPDRRQSNELVERFFAAAREGDLRGLEEMLTADVISVADGGGKISSARRPVVGAERVARYLAGGFGRFATAMEIGFAEVNGQPALVGVDGGVLRGVAVADVLDGRIAALRIVTNPEKLGFLARQVDALSHSE